MKYIVRLNPHAQNPLTKQIREDRLWEVEQCANKDSEKVIWHCGDVRVDSVPICELYQFQPTGEKPWDIAVFGICTRGQDSAIEIRTGPKDASGN